MNISGILIKRSIFFSFLLLFIIYSAHIYTFNAASPGNISKNPDAQKGKQLFQEYNCASCHQLYGLGGYMGPDLTNVVSNPSKGEKYAYAVIRSGTQKMPNFNLSDAEANCLVAYLKEVDRTGFSPVPAFTVHLNGDVNYDQ